MARIIQTFRKAMSLYQWIPLPLEVVNLEPLDSSSDSSDGKPEIIEIYSDNESDDSVDFEPELKVKLEVENGGLGELEFEDPEVDRPKKKLRIEGYNSDACNARF
jgi:hypothetical protein